MNDNAPVNQYVNDIIRDIGPGMIRDMLLLTLGLLAARWLYRTIVAYIRRRAHDESLTRFLEQARVRKDDK